MILFYQPFQELKRVTFFQRLFFGYNTETRSGYKERTETFRMIPLVNFSKGVYHYEYWP